MHLFKEKKIQKYYVAILKGYPKKESGLIDLPLKNIKVDGEDKMIVDHTEGKRSLTRFRVVKKLNKHHTLVCLKPLTGRKHQLRVHMASLGIPI